jgi:hypothetical protein
MPLDLTVLRQRAEELLAPNLGLAVQLDGSSGPDDT